MIIVSLSTGPNRSSLWTVCAALYLRMLRLISSIVSWWGTSLALATECKDVFRGRLVRNLCSTCTTAFISSFFIAFFLWLHKTKLLLENLSSLIAPLWEKSCKLQNFGLLEFKIKDIVWFVLTLQTPVSYNWLRHYLASPYVIIYNLKNQKLVCLSFEINTFNLYK